MTAALPMERVEAKTRCPHCTSPVLVTVNKDRQRKTLEPTPVPGGQFVLDSNGVAVRRRVTDMFHENQAGASVHGGGLNPHRCSHR